MNEKNNCSKKKSEDKPKEETTPFTNATEKSLLALLLFNKEAAEDMQYVRPENFNSLVIRDMVKLVCDFYEKYSRLPTPDEFHQRLVNFLNSKEEKYLSAPRSKYYDVYDEVLSRKEEDLEPAQDLFRRHARFQAHNEALDKIIEKRMVEKEDYDGIQKLMTEAYAVGSGGEGLVEKNLSEVPEKIEFLVKGRMVKGGITLIAGRGGTGKGAFTTGTIGAAVTAGGTVFGEQLEQGLVFLFNREDLTRIVLNRLENNEGRVENLKWLELAKDRNGYSPTFSLKHNIPLLIKKLKQVPEALLTNSLLVIDGIGTFMGMKRGSDAYNDVDVRNVLAPLSQIGEEFNIAVVIIGHFNKTKTSDLIHAILASTAFVDISRAVYAIIADEEEKERHYFLPLKWNIPELKNTGIEFIIEKDTDKIKIVGEISAEDVEDLKAEHQPGQARALRPREEAKRFLAIVLKDGRRNWKEINKMAKANNINQTTLYNARNEMGIRTVYDAFGVAYWIWDRQSTEEQSLDEAETKETPVPEDAKRKVDEIRAKQKKEEKVEQKRSPEEEAAISEERRKTIEEIRKKHQ